MLNPNEETYIEFLKLNQRVGFQIITQDEVLDPFYIKLLAYTDCILNTMLCIVSIVYIDITVNCFELYQEAKKDFFFIY